MNYEQINNGEERIFPFYKGQYMGNTPLGFSNKKSAQKFMNDIPLKDIYEKFGGEEEYNRTHMYLCRPYNADAIEQEGSKCLFCFNSPKENYYGQRRFDNIPDKNLEDIVYIKDIPENDFKEMKESIDKIGFIYDANTKEKRKIISDFIEKWNLFPELLIDRKDFEKIRTEMRKYDVDYRKGIININVTYLD